MIPDETNKPLIPRLDPKETDRPLIPRLDPEEWKRRGLAAAAHVREWSEDEESAQDQAETWEVLREALRADWIASDRPPSP